MYASVSFTLKRTFPELTTFDVGDRIVTINETENLTVHCLGSSPTSLIHYMGWYRSDDSDPWNTSFPVYTLYMSNNWFPLATMFITSVAATHEGFYFCMASNKAGNSYSDFVYVKVLPHQDNPVTGKRSRMAYSFNESPNITLVIAMSFVTLYAYLDVSSSHMTCL